MDLKKIIASCVVIDNLSEQEIYNLIVLNSESTLGDYTLPCFSLSKTLKKSPIVISEHIKQNLKPSEFIERTETVNGYLNFYLNKSLVTEKVISDILLNKNNYFKQNIGNNKVICIDYSSANLAKYMHIGHLSTTLIGESIARLYENFGYKVVRINYIGDYGTPFGKMVAAYFLWGNEEDINKNGVDAIQSLYVKFSKEAEKDDSLNELARITFKQIEDKEQKAYSVYKWFIDISIKETKRLLDYLGVHFDSWKGEASYSDDLDAVVKKLNNAGLLKISQNAKIVDLSEYNLGVCLIQKSDGTSLYITRDIAAATDRYNEYKFNKMLYVTAVQQKQHFSQLFKVLDLMDEPFATNLNHIYYGMFSLPTGKIASRKGKQAVLVDLIDFAESKVKEIIADRSFTTESRENIIKKIALSALAYSVIKNDRLKDCVFDTENAFKFEGDTAPYMLYTYTRICSILRKYNDDKISSASLSPDYSCLKNEESFELVKNIYLFKETLLTSLEKHEPSLTCKKVMDTCKAFNQFYTKHKVLDGNPITTLAKMNLLKAVAEMLNYGLYLTCIETIQEM